MKKSSFAGSEHKAHASKALTENNYVMQPFKAEAMTSDDTFLPALIYLPVTQPITSSSDVTFNLTPKSEST